MAGANVSTVQLEINVDAIIIITIITTICLSAGFGLNQNVSAGFKLNSSVSAGFGLNRTVSSGFKLNSDISAGFGLNHTLIGSVPEC